MMATRRSCISSGFGDTSIFGVELFDKSFRVWRIYWMDTNGATLFPPVEGSFFDSIGLFRGHDQQDGIPVLVEFAGIRQILKPQRGSNLSLLIMEIPGK